MTGGIAWIDVGTEHIPFDIHIELLCEYSAFFNEHFKDRCTQVVSGTVHLRDCDPDLFTEFVNLVDPDRTSPFYTAGPLKIEI